MSATPQTLGSIFPSSVQVDLPNDTTADANPAVIAQPPSSIVLDWSIFGIMSVILVLLSVLLVTNLKYQRANYEKGLIAALQDPVDHAAALTYARSSDVAVIKMSALFLGFLLIFTGAMYVLRNATTQFTLQASGVGYGGGLRTSSPGLVVLSLGVLLVGTALLSEHDIQYSASPAATDEKPAENIQSGAATAIPTQQTLQLVKPQ